MLRLILMGYLLLCTAPLFALDIRTNNNPLQSEPPIMLSQVKNGVRFSVGSGEETIALVHLWGSSYEMGFAYGQLMKTEIQKAIPTILEAMSDRYEIELESLDEVYKSAAPFIPEHFLEELHGLADASGVDFQTLIRANLMGEASEWHCSLYGAWDTATTGKTLQLRALDYATAAGIQDHPVITIYHPSEGHPFANIGWVGVIGSVTGLSSKQIGISEIGDDYDKENDTFEGLPFMFLLRDVLQFDQNLTQATDRIKTATRTTSLMYAVGSGQENKVLAYQTGHSLCRVFDDNDLEPLVETHPRIEDIVYWGLSWNVPRYDGPLSQMLQKYHGQLTPEITLQEILPTVHTGNLQVAIYNLTDNILYTANAKGANESGPLNAYERPYIRVEMNPLFNFQPPVLEPTTTGTQ